MAPIMIQLLLGGGAVALVGVLVRLALAWEDRSLARQIAVAPY